MSDDLKIPWLTKISLRDKILFAGWLFCSALIIIGAYLIYPKPCTISINRPLTLENSKSYNGKDIRALLEAEGYKCE